MDNYVIVSDSTLDLSQDMVKDLQVEVIPMKYVINDKIYIDGEHNSKDFYDELRKGISVSTTQINTEEFLEFFSWYLSEGKDVLYIGFSSGLSGTYNNAVNASKQLRESYPNNKVVVVDSFSASVGQGLLVYYAALKRKSGYSLEELEKWVIENRTKLCHWFTVDDLHHLKRSGRISSTIAVIGSVLNVKPLLFVDNEGRLKMSEKVRGRRKTLDLMVSKMYNACLDIDNLLISICHGDCLDDAEYVARKIRDEFSTDNIIIRPMGSIIGTHTGPGTLGLGFLGNSR